MGPDAEARRRRMVAGEVRRGISDPLVIGAMEAVAREAFVPARHVPAAYEERPLPIGSSQTISQPLVVAMMTQALQLDGTERVLEVGTGSGYQAAVLRQIVPHVVSVERLGELADQARRTLDRMGVDGVEVHVGDGSLGWPPGGPFDAIVVTAAGPHVPPALVEQLAPGGRLVMPVGGRRAQRLVRLVKAADGEITTEDLGSVGFVPLVGEEGWPTADG